MKNNTIATAGDRNYLWGIFMMIASLRRKGMDENVLVGTKGFDAEAAEILTSMGGVRLIPLDDFGRSLTCCKAMMMLQADTDYIWRSRVTSTYYCGCMYSYCISYFFVAPLWIIGFPCGSSRNELCMTFELVERATGNVVWSYDYRGSDYIVHWIYARIGKDTSLYARLMKQAMNGALVSLSQRMPTLAK